MRKREDKIRKVQEIYSQRAKSGFKSDPTNRWDYLYSKLTTDWWLLSQIDIEGKKILNIGCAQPRDEINFAPRIKEWIAIDLNKDVIEVSREAVSKTLNPELASKIRFQVADATKLPFGNDTFDIVVSFSTIDHIFSSGGRKKAIKEMSRVVKKGGYVIITVPNKLNFAYWFWSKKKTQAGYEYCFFPWELKRYLKEAKLKPLKFTSNFKISLGIWLDFLRLLFLPIEYFGFRMGYLSQKI